MDSPRQSLRTTHYSLLTAHYSLLTTRCSLLTAHYSLLTTHCCLLTAAYRPRGPAVAYGEHLVAYRRAHGIRTALWAPPGLLSAATQLVHAIVQGTPLRRWGRARAVDYLLQAS